MLKSQHYKQLAILSILFILVLVCLSSYLSEPSDKAIDIISNEALSSEDKFIQMTSLAYQGESDPKALFLLYNMLYYGQGTPESPDSALLILEKSAKAGYGVAQEELGFIYLYGREHYKKDLGLAHYWLKKAADSGMKKSFKFLYSS